jgi:hypothetical protein
MQPIGRRRWAIAEGYIPSQSSFTDTALVSHETACILNAGDQQAHVSITLFFADREPVGPYRVTIAPRRTLHLRFNDLKEPAPVPRDTDFSSVFEADVPDCCAAHAPRFATCRNKPVVDDSICGGLSAGTVRPSSRRIKRSIPVPISQAFLPFAFMNRCSKMWNKS